MDDLLINSEEEESGDSVSNSNADKPALSNHGIVLFLVCGLPVSLYFIYDDPAALQDVILPTLNITLTQFGTFYSIYSWPNVILSVFGGLLVDNVIGIRWGGLLFASLITVGQLLFAVGAMLRSYWVMLLGRLFFGLGGENLNVVHALYIIVFYKDSKLTFLMGLQVAIARVASLLNLNILAPIYFKLDELIGASHLALGATLFVGVAVCILSLLCSIGLFFYTPKRYITSEKKAPSCHTAIRDIGTFVPSYWLICVVCTLLYSAVIPFISFGQVFFEMKFDYPTTRADLVNSVIYFVSMLGTPLAGYIVDLTGRNIIWMAAGCFLSALFHFLLGFSFVNPFLTTCGLGIAFSMVTSALWPCISYILPEDRQGTGYGIMQAVQNLGLAVIPILLALIVDNNGYSMASLLFAGMLLCAAMLCGVMLSVDNVYGGTINWSAKERRAKSANKKD